MTNSLHLTNQEINIINFLTSSKQDVSWEELIQFSKNPQTVKLKTVKKTISALKRKYSLAGMPFPYTHKFYSLATPNKKSIVPEQKLVQIKSTPNGNIIPVNSSTYSCQVDFKLNRNTKSVVTIYGSSLLGDNEWDVFKYFHNNPERIIKLSELRDKVVFPQYGSKLPARWFDSISRIVQKLRRQVPTLKSRLMTITGLEETSYMFK